MTEQRLHLYSGAPKMRIVAFALVFAHSAAIAGGLSLRRTVGVPSTRGDGSVGTAASADKRKNPITSTTSPLRTSVDPLSLAGSSTTGGSAVQSLHDVSAPSRPPDNNITAQPSFVRSPTSRGTSSTNPLQLQLQDQPASTQFQSPDHAAQQLAAVCSSAGAIATAEANPNPSASGGQHSFTLMASLFETVLAQAGSARMPQIPTMSVKQMQRLVTHSCYTLLRRMQHQQSAGSSSPGAAPGHQQAEEPSSDHSEQQRTPVVGGTTTTAATDGASSFAGGAAASASASSPRRVSASAFGSASSSGGSSSASSDRSPTSSTPTPAGVGAALQFLLGVAQGLRGGGAPPKPSKSSSSRRSGKRSSRPRVPSPPDGGPLKRVEQVDGGLASLGPYAARAEEPELLKGASSSGLSRAGKGMHKSKSSSSVSCNLAGLATTSDDEEQCGSRGRHHRMNSPPGRGTSAGGSGAAEVEPRPHFSPPDRSRSSSSTSFGSGVSSPTRGSSSPLTASPLRQFSGGSGDRGTASGFSPQGLGPTSGSAAKDDEHLLRDFVLQPASADPKMQEEDLKILQNEIEAALHESLLAVTQSPVEGLGSPAGGAAPTSSPTAASFSDSSSGDPDSFRRRGSLNQFSTLQRSFSSGHELFRIEEEGAHCSSTSAFASEGDAFQHPSGELVGGGGATSPSTSGNCASTSASRVVDDVVQDVKMLGLPVLPGDGDHVKGDFRDGSEDDGSFFSEDDRSRAASPCSAVQAPGFWYNNYRGGPGGSTSRSRGHGSTTSKSRLAEHRRMRKIPPSSQKISESTSDEDCEEELQVEQDGGQVRRTIREVEDPGAIFVCQTPMPDVLDHAPGKVLGQMSFLHRGGDPLPQRKPSSSSLATTTTLFHRENSTLSRTGSTGSAASGSHTGLSDLVSIANDASIGPPHEEDVPPFYFSTGAAASEHQGPYVKQEVRGEGTISSGPQ
ncbi:unnamed protein product [Amoebophrya sp. A120]|nr:unnamed protein product [Amoebophrya sp. A120]|eukprot:GSA120T00000761001.1